MMSEDALASTTPSTNLARRFEDCVLNRPIQSAGRRSGPDVRGSGRRQPRLDHPWMSVLQRRKTPYRSLASRPSPTQSTWGRERESNPRIGQTTTRMSQATLLTGPTGRGVARRMPEQRIWRSAANRHAVASETKARGRVVVYGFVESRPSIERPGHWTPCRQSRGGVCYASVWNAGVARPGGSARDIERETRGHSEAGSKGGAARTCARIGSGAGRSLC
ncbi:hypothetical protein BCV70DRAFT_45885 [Testicularia cyperi]|uniref:Uncharacterized protein n=1 Tax=Testicularia cyperi TaxID=1882483 RepID=A0A317XHS3_9BASI|nr:hypothetical protein BCV70DRAFT_45885 [Testicularia cyperi]